MLNHFYNPSNFLYTYSREPEIDVLETQIQQKDVFTKYENCTQINLLNFDKETENLQFDIKNKSWKIVLIGKYYNIENGNLVDFIQEEDIKKYTQITPPALNEGDEIFFDVEKQDWQYTKASEKTLKDLKTQKNNEFENNYKQSKLKCKISYNNISYSRIEGIDNLIDLCNLWKGYTGGDLIPSINLPISNLQNIFNKTMLLRDTIAKNVENVKAQINNLNSVENINNFKTDLKIVFDEELKIENL